MHLAPDQIDELLNALHEFHAEYGAMDTLLDERRERLLLEDFRRFLEHFLEEHDSANPEASVRLARDYFAENIPFVLLMGSFNHLKERLVRLVAANTADPVSHFREIDTILERAKRDTAREYLMLETDRPLPLPEAMVHDKILIRIYLDWLEQVNRAIVGDLAKFPLQPAGQSDFAQALLYPESLLICLDLRICDQIMEQHRLIFQQASILYAMLQSTRYEQAYVAYQEMVHRVVQLLNLLGVLYFETQTNRVSRFFNFVQAALFLPGRKFFCVINLGRLGKLNQLYGTETGDLALDCVERALRAAFEDNQDWMLYTRGIAGDFYLFGINTDPQKLCSLLAAIASRVEHESRSEPRMPIDLEIRYHGAELTDLGELTTENMHLMVKYLTEQAHTATRHLDTEAEHTQAMLSWIRQQHRRSVDLRNKLREEETEIFIQPLVTLDRRREIHAFEVLGRFREGDGYLSAGLFIDDIINMGLITEFDRLILKAIERQAEELSSITQRLFINVSSASLQQESYVRELVELREGALASFDLVVELTEQILLDCRKLVIDLHKQHGFVFAIDDFGTGYSSLQTVIELALEGGVRYLKLDGSLTRDLTTSEANERIMQITRQMARELGLETVVEFIETQAQVDKLEDLHIDLGQGYLIGIPDPVPVWAGKLNYLKSARADGDAGSFVF